MKIGGAPGGSPLSRAEPLGRVSVSTPTEGQLGPSAGATIATPSRE